MFSSRYPRGREADVDFHPAATAHPAFVVDDVRGLAEAASAVGFEVKDDESLDGFDRIDVYDPFGNRIELMQPTSQPAFWDWRAESWRPGAKLFAHRSVDIAAGDERPDALTSFRSSREAVGPGWPTWRLPIRGIRERGAERGG